MGIVEATGLEVSLDGTPVLRGVDLSVGERETVALLGGNGSGKTTTLRAVLGLVPRQAGQISLFGTPLDDFRAWARIGYVPQHGAVQVGNATIWELVASGRLPHRRLFRPLTPTDNTAIDDALAMVALTDLAHQPMAHLSGGQRQRALIARALATRPDLIVLDEPLAGLDTVSQDELTDVLERLKEAGLAILVVLHELGPFQPMIDRGVVLRQGVVIHDGPLQSAGEVTHEHAHHHDDQPAAHTWAAGLAREATR
ncbi:MAG: ABC transporter ATP-binding protein [Propionibacteriaceae bacterium]|nr:ABC transporter ATP-binding protein [Propionibacteriaceae bacterium]